MSEIEIITDGCQLDDQTIRLDAMQAEFAWTVEADIRNLMQPSRLKILRGLEAQRDNSELIAAMAVIAKHRWAMLDSLKRLAAWGPMHEPASREGRLFLRWRDIHRA